MTPDSAMMNIMWQGLVDRQRIIREIPIDWTAQNINSNDILISSYTCKCTMNIQLHLDLKFLNLEWTIHQCLHPCRPGRKHHLSIVHIPPTSFSSPRNWQLYSGLRRAASFSLQVAVSCLHCFRFQWGVCCFWYTGWVRYRGLLKSLFLIHEDVGRLRL